jgi:osmotically-inducible protein OsmY
MLGLKIYLLILMALLQSACISNIMAGANIIYDRHQIYKKSSDIALAAKVGHAIKMSPELNCPSNQCFEIAVFHGDVLVLGTVPSELEKNKVTDAIQGIKGYRHFYNFIQIDPNFDYQQRWTDHWITTQTRSKIMANAEIDPNPFKIVSHQQVVYVMGDVLDYQETLIIDICRNVSNVNKVVNLLQVYNLEKRPAKRPPPSASPTLPTLTPSW